MVRLASSLPSVSGAMSTLFASSGRHQISSSVNDSTRHAAAAIARHSSAVPNRGTSLALLNNYDASSVCRRHRSQHMVREAGTSVPDAVRIQKLQPLVAFRGNVEYEPSPLSNS